MYDKQSMIPEDLRGCLWR